MRERGTLYDKTEFLLYKIFFAGGRGGGAGGGGGEGRFNLERGWFECKLLGS
jgi:hypothetical protein